MNIDNPQTLKLLKTCFDLWEGAPTPELWGASSTPDENLLWKKGHPRQVKDLLALSHLLDFPVRIVGFHTSKSVRLPVGMFRLDVGEETAWVFTRDNFYDLKVAVVSSCPITMDHSLVHTAVTAEDIEKKKARAYDSMSKDKDFDPSLFESDAWLEGWSHDTILRDGEAIYLCGTTSWCYYEGMDILPHEVFQRYEHGSKAFAAPVRRAKLMLLIDEIMLSLYRA